jgi:putative ABC transport system substrate-binding protein
MRRDPDPIVSAEGDPVGTGFVVSLAPPGGNITGLSFQQTDFAIKRLELLREVVPALRRLAGGHGGNSTYREYRSRFAGA